MPENSIIRAASVIIVMLVFGFGWYAIALSRLKGAGVEAAAAKIKASTQAKYVALLAAFLYLLSMISIARLFL